MNHTKTAQAAMAQTATGVAPEISAETTIQIGFEKALIMMNPEWRKEVAPELVNQFRHFYHRGHQDISFLIQMSNQNMQQNLEAVMNTVIVTGNEEKIAQMQKDALDAAEAKPKKARGTKAPASKAPQVSKKAAPKAVPAKVGKSRK